jgi:HEAT repeat protein
VRTAAGLRLKFYRDPAGGEALAAFFVAETDPQVRNALLSRIADQVRSAGISVAYDKLAGYMGEPIKALLLRELNNPDAEVRRAIASALERLRGAEVAEAMLARLRLEADQTVKAVLALFNGFAVIAEQSLPVLASLLAADPNPTIRTRVAFLLGSFGQPAVPLLLAALADEPARRAAVMSLGPLGPLSVLPHLLHQLIDPANKSIERELESAVSSVVARAAAAADPNPLPSPELSAHIQARIDALQPDPFRAWPIRLCKEELNALPLHGNQIYLWALQPDGTLLSLDHEAFRQPVEPETDPLTRFAVMVHGTRTYPELAALLPTPPQGIRVCLVCLGNGRWSDEQDRGQACQSCGGLGWRFFKRPA